MIFPFVTEESRHPRKDVLMDKEMHKILKIIDTIFLVIETVVYTAMIFVVLLQIFARIFLPQVPAWTEELSRFLQIYLVAFTAGMAVKYNSFISVDTIYHFVGERTKLILRTVVNAIIAILFAFFFVSSIQMYTMGRTRTAVSMTWITMNKIYFSMVLTGLTVFLSIIRKELSLINAYRKGGVSE